MITRRLFQPHPSMQPKTDGYIVIIVLLLTAVLLMLGLSLATRTTEEVYLSGQEADTTRVFNAAETGIEEALYKLQVDSELGFGEEAAPIQVNVLDGSGADLIVTGQQASEFDLTVAQGEVLTLAWKSGTTISWTHANDCSNAAAIIVTLYNTTGPTASHVAYNPYKPAVGLNPECDKGTGFDRALGSDGTSSVRLDLATFGLGLVEPPVGSILRIRPLYADASFHVTNSSAVQLISTASDTTGGGTSAETRRIQVIRTEPAAPAIFDYAVFSGETLAK